MIRFSKSKLNTFLACPRKYYLHYELEIRTLSTSRTLVEGSAIHHLVESSLIYGGLITDVIEEASRAFWSERPLESCDYEGELEYLAAQATCLEQSKAFLRELGPLPARSMELELTSPLIHPLTGEESSDISLIGYLDLLLVGEDGSPCLVDLKTTAKSPFERMAHSALELSFYAYLHEQPFSEHELRNVSVALIHLIRAKQPKVIWDESIRGLPHYLEVFEICEKVADLIIDGCFWKNAGSHCSWCSFKSLCFSDEVAAIATFGEQVWQLYQLDQSSREEIMLAGEISVNF